MINSHDIQQVAMRILARRACSNEELSQKLCAKGYQSEAINEVINCFVERGYLNDAALCHMLFTKYYQSGRYGLKMIILKLKQRGLSESIIAEVIGKNDVSDEWQLALKAVQRHFKDQDTLESLKVGRFLMAKGFSSAIITKVLQELHQVNQNLCI